MLWRLSRVQIAMRGGALALGLSGLYCYNKPLRPLEAQSHIPCCDLPFGRSGRTIKEVALENGVNLQCRPCDSQCLHEKDEE